MDANIQQTTNEANAILDAFKDKPAAVVRTASEMGITQPGLDELTGETSEITEPPTTEQEQTQIKQKTMQIVEYLFKKIHELEIINNDARQLSRPLGKRGRCLFYLDYDEQCRDIQGNITSYALVKLAVNIHTLDNITTKFLFGFNSLPIYRFRTSLFIDSKLFNEILAGRSFQPIDLSGSKFIDARVDVTNHICGGFPTISLCRYITLFDITDNYVDGTIDHICLGNGDESKELYRADAKKHTVSVNGTTIEPRGISVGDIDSANHQYMRVLDFISFHMMKCW